MEGDGQDQDCDWPRDGIKEMPAQPAFQWYGPLADIAMQTAATARLMGHEPRVALDAGAYGIDIFRRLLKDAPAFLRPGGVLVFEIGEGQEKIVERLMRKARGWRDPFFERDREGQIRVLGAHRAED